MKFFDDWAWGVSLNPEVTFPVTASNVEHYLDAGVLHVKSREGWRRVRRDGATRRTVTGRIAWIPVKYGVYGVDRITEPELCAVAHSPKYWHAEDVPEGD